MTGCNVRLRRVIVDRKSNLPDDFRAGYDHAADRARGFHVSAGGVTLVTADMLALNAERDASDR